MNVIIVGGGRFGSALARRSCGRGHETLVLYRNSIPDLTHGNGVKIPCRPIMDYQPGGDRPDLVLLAAPANADAGSEALLEAFLAKLDPGILVASADAYPGAPHARLARGRRYIRFLSSPALSDPDHRALLIINAADPSTARELFEWFGPANAVLGDDDAFARHGVLMTLGTVAHLAAITGLGIAIDTVEHDVVMAGLEDASALLRYARGDERWALDACSTPGGMSERIATKLHPILNDLYRELGGRDFS